MTITSYAQNFEDIMLWRSLKHIAGGKYIDIGAQDPIVDSVSFLFYKHGWRGLHVEPSPAYAESLRRERPDEIVIQAAVARKSGMKKFYEIPTTGLSTGDREIAESHKNRGYPFNEIVVTGITLEEIFSTQLNSEIHWLKIDVEGEEKNVLESWGGSEVRPWIVLVESTVPLTTIDCHEKWEYLLLERDYDFTYFDGLNRFYVAREHEDLNAAFRVSPNIFDDFTLSGQSNSPLTRLLNERLNTLETNNAHERRTVEERIHAQVGATSAKLSELQSEFEQLKALSSAKQDELQLQLITSSNLLARLTNDHIGRERDLSDSVLKTQAELSKTIESIATQDERFVSDLARQGELLSHQMGQIDQRQQSIERQLLTAIEASSSQMATSAKLSELQGEFEQLKTLYSAKQDELQLQLITSSSLLARLTNDHIGRERDLSDSVLKTQAELSKTIEAIAAQDARFVSQLARQGELLSQKIGQIDQRQHSLERQLLTAVEASSAQIIENRVTFTEALNDIRQYVSAFADRTASDEERIMSDQLAQSERIAAISKQSSNSIGQIAETNRTVLQVSTEINSRVDSAITELNHRLTESYRSATSRQDAIDLIIQEIRGDGIELQKKSDDLSSVYRRQLDELNGSLRDILVGIYSMERRSGFGRARNVIARAATLPILNILSRQGAIALDTSQQPRESIFARSVYQRSFIPHSDGRYCLSDFADLYDKDFVRAAYLAILRREPDPEGESYYLGQIRSGEPREKLLGQILGSPEARRHVTVIEGLRLHSRLRKLFELPLLGTLASAIVFLLSIGSHLRELRALDNHVTRIAEESQRRELFNLERLRSLNK
jgi:FkbM family methyltransferase